MFCSLNLIERNGSEDVIESAVNSFLGSNKSLKFIIDGNETMLVSCPYPLFQNIILKHPLEYIMEETLHAHHEHFGFGTTSLLAMWYFWNKEFKHLIKNGIQPITIVSIVEMGLQHVITQLPAIEVLTETFLNFFKNAENRHASKGTQQNIRRLSRGEMEQFFVPSSTFHTCPTLELTSSKELCPSPQKQFANYSKTFSRGIILHSRHLTSLQYLGIEETEQSKVSETIMENASFAVCDSSKDISEFLEKNIGSLTNIVNKFCHHYVEMLDVVVDLWKKQITQTKSSRFCLESVNVCSILGPSSCNTVVDGLLVKANLNESYYQYSDSLSRHRCLLINGDVTLSYTHLGFAPTTSITTYESPEQLLSSAKNVWLKSCEELLCKLQVTLLLVRGKVDPVITYLCARHSIVLITGVPYKVLQILAAKTKTSIATYILGCDEENIASNISIVPWQVDNRIVLNCIPNEKSHYFLIDADVPSVQTAILYHPSPPVLRLHEHQFWHVCSRLSLATKARAVLPGGGQTEKWCGQLLQELANTKKDNEEAEVLRAMANGFVFYSEAVTTKQALEIDHSKIRDALDEMESKIQSWHSALSLNFLTIRADSVVINGCDESLLKSNCSSDLYVGHL